MSDPSELAAQVRAHDRRAIARAITLVESTRDDDRDAAEKLLSLLLPHTGRALRVGVSGTPGVGKSSFIEALGLHVVDGRPAAGAGSTTSVDAASGVTRVAVLAVDPSSPTSGGSLLGDKTRMDKLATHPKAFVRPSPSSGALGGTAPHTRDAMLVLEAAGFDVVIVETVGVGQSEAAVADLVDTFVLLLHPGGGDELQGAKRGVLELVDLLVVHKSDLPEAQQTFTDYVNASQLFARAVPVLLASSKAERGVDDVWRAIVAHRAQLEQDGALASRRERQAERAFWRAIESELVAQLRADPQVAVALAERIAEVRGGAVSAARAARDLLKIWRS